MNKEIRVSVICTVYNHELYIERAIDSFLMQKTDFDYEILIHDDASTDNTTIILRKYEKMNPQIKVIYQTENQYSKHVSIVEKFVMPLVNGKYVAFCEGDDYWCDENKLQMQYAYMETHPECSLCVHNSRVHDLNCVRKDGYFNNWKKIHKMTAHEVFIGWKVHTSSYFLGASDVYKPDYAKNYWFGDYVRLTVAYSKGEIVALPYVMSVYNLGVKTGAMYSVDSQEIDKRTKKILDRKRYLEEYNLATHRQFEKSINERILQIHFECDSLGDREVIIHSNSREESIQAAKHAASLKWYKPYISSLGWKQKIKELFKYQGYLIYRYWKGFWVDK